MARPGLMTAAAAALFLLAVPANAEIVRFDVALSGENQVPPAGTPGLGTLVATFDTETNILSWTVTLEGLTGPATAAHFHGPADPGQNGGVLVPLEGELISPIEGNAVLTAEIAAALMDGMIYLNIHTAAFPGGEIRGQLLLPTD